MVAVFLVRIESKFLDFLHHSGIDLLQGSVGRAQKSPLMLILYFPKYAFSPEANLNFDKI